jgi:hypothetical protein
MIMSWVPRSIMALQVFRSSGFVESQLLFG